MAPPVLSTDNAAPIAPETVLTFPDNRLLIELCGQFDSHLTQIETALDVQIVRRGNELAILGDADAAARAAEAVRALYARLEEGRAVEPGDVDAAIRMGSSERGTGARAGDQHELFPSGRVEIRTRKKTIEPRTKRQRTYIEQLFSNELVFGLGPAGTGKTYLAVAVGVSMFIEGRVDRIILSRPAVEAGERLGFLPGDMKDKVDPYLRPLYDALYDMMPGERVMKRRDAGEIEIAPLAYMRGRTLSNAFVILDEAQNTTPMQMKMFLTRMGENSRMVVTGDPSQIDLPLGSKSGLVDALEILSGIEKIYRIQFSHADVVRHPLVTRIVQAYDSHDSRLMDTER